MNRTHRWLPLALALPLTVGCASLTPPFDDMDKAQIKVLRLRATEPPPPAPVAQPGIPGLPAIPGIPPELQQAGQQMMQGLQQMIPPGMLPPGLIPGQPAPMAAPPQPVFPRFPTSAAQTGGGFAILAEMPLAESQDDLRDELLELFGDEDNFQPAQTNCFSPGLGVSMLRSGQAPVDLMVSLSCSQVVGDGFRWPYPVNGLTPESRMRFSKIYEKLFGPVPPDA